MYQAVEGRWGSREVEITDVALLDASGQQSFVFHSGDRVSIRLKVRAAHPIDDFVFGIGLFNADGVCCYGTNTYLEEMNPEQLAATPKRRFQSTAWIWSKARTSSTLRYTSATATPTTTTVCSTPSE